jgi:SNF2 family DNA or RNA helicase
VLYKTLWPAQKKAVRFALRNGGTCLFFDQGTGKTHVTLAVIDEESREELNYQAIVVCLKTNLHSTWVDKCTQLLPHVHVATNFDDFLALPFPRVLFINYEGTNNKRLRQRIARVPWSFAAFDEAQRLKKRSSLSSRFARMLRDVPRRMALSGTPFDKNPTDLWAILRFVNYKLLGSRTDSKGRKAWLGDNWPSFFNKYLKPAGYMGYGHKFRTKLLEEKFLDTAAEISLRIDRSILNLKGSSMTPVYFDMDPEQRRFYDKLERDLVVEFENDGDSEARIISTPMKATLQMKLHQITGGFIRDDDQGVHVVGNSKLRALRDLLEREERVPVVVFYVHKPEGEMIVKLLKRMYHRVAQLHGKVKDKKRTKARTQMIYDFQAGKIDALAIQQRTGGVGVDLFKASLGVFYSSTHSWIDFEQAKSRLERHGQEKYVDFFYLMAKDSVDEDRYDAVSKKSKLNEATFRRLKRRNVMALKPKSAKSSDAKSEKVEKASKKTAAPKAEKAEKAPKTEKTAAETFKYGVADLQKALGHGDPASTRVALRKHGIAKAGKSYGWNTRDELDAVVKKIKSTGEKAEKADAGDKKAKKAKK